MRRADESRRIPTSPDKLSGVEPDRGHGGDPSGYQAPALVELGSVRNVVLGSASGGNNDSNGQYYW